MKVDIEAEVLELFKKLIAVKGIEEKDILKIFESGNRIVLFPKDIAHLICKYTTKKHINIDNISISIHNALHNHLLKKKTILELFGNGSSVDVSFLSF